MSSNGSLINNLLNSNSNSALNSLEKYRDDMLKKLQSKTGNNEDGDASSHISRKETMAALQGVTKQIQQVQYAKTAQKLQEDWYKNESSPAKSPSKREKIRREHETYLFNVSMGKLSLAKAGISVDENVKEAKEMGIEAAEVERKRQKDEMDAGATNDNSKNNTLKAVSAIKKKKKKLSLNILV